jgi:hypothetical protein
VSNAFFITGTISSGFSINRPFAPKVDRSKLDCRCTPYFAFSWRATMSWVPSIQTMCNRLEVGGPLLPHPPAKKRTTRSMSPCITAFSRSV